MPVETATVISELDATWPTGAHNISEGADHVRLIKAVLQSQFPNLDAPVTTTPDEMNSGGTPVGGIQMFGGSAAPTGFLLCNGAEIDRTTYSALYTVITDTYGAGDGSTTFNIPDMRDSVAGGASSNNDLGDISGKDDWTQSDMPKQTMGTTGSHRHSTTHGVSNDFDFPGSKNGLEAINQDTNFNTSYAGDHSHSLNNSGNNTVNNRQATLYINYIIKT